MDQSQKRSSVYTEYAIATFTGAAFGMTNTVVGHPFDTIKTKMTAQDGFISGKGAGGMVATMKTVYAKEGAVGFYRGCIPPMWGSAVYRSTQFAVFDL